MAHSAHNRFAAICSCTLVASLILCSAFVHADFVYTSSGESCSECPCTHTSGSGSTLGGAGVYTGSTHTFISMGSCGTSSSTTIVAHSQDECTPSDKILCCERVLSYSSVSGAGGSATNESTQACFARNGTRDAESTGRRSARVGTANGRRYTSSNADDDTEGVQLGADLLLLPFRLGLPSDNACVYSSCALLVLRRIAGCSLHLSFTSWHGTQETFPPPRPPP